MRPAEPVFHAVGIPGILEILAILAVLQIVAILFDLGERPVLTMMAVFCVAAVGATA